MQMRSYGRNESLLLCAMSGARVVRAEAMC
jgi:hypothetical protein